MNSYASKIEYYYHDVNFTLTNEFKCIEREK